VYSFNQHATFQADGVVLSLNRFGGVGRGLVLTLILLLGGLVMGGDLRI